MRRIRSVVLVAIAAGFLLGGFAGALAFNGWPPLAQGGATVTPNHPVWTEVQWPFAMDEWGKGKAFRCLASDCGVEVSVYIRPKIGFCNCTTGVADDADLDRLTDFSLMGDKPAVLGAGQPINAAWMKGRSRSYTVTSAFHPTSSALAIALNSHCDAVVATAVVAQPRPDVLAPSVVAFLNSKTVVMWTEAALGL